MHRSHSPNQRHKEKLHHRRNQSQQRPSQGYHTSHQGVGHTNPNSQYQDAGSQNQHQPQHHNHPHHEHAVPYQVHISDYEHLTRPQGYQPQQSHPPSPSPSSFTSSPIEQRSAHHFPFDPNLLSPIQTRQSSIYSLSQSRSPSHSPTSPYPMATTMNYPSMASEGLPSWDNREVYLSPPHRHTYHETTPNSLYGYKPSRLEEVPPLPGFMVRGELDSSQASHEPIDAAPALSQQSGSYYGGASGIPDYPNYGHHESIATGSSDGDDDHAQRDLQNREYYVSLAPRTDGAGLLEGIGGGTSEAERNYISPSEVMSAPYLHEDPHYPHYHPPSNILARHGSTRSRSSNSDKEASTTPPRRRGGPYSRPTQKPASDGLSRRGNGISSLPRQQITPHSHRKAPRPFHCTFRFANCLSTFSSKNEWKRHVSSQHTQLTIWKCQSPACESKPNAVFNRKDLFSQHLKRTHIPGFTSTGPHPEKDIDRQKKEWAANELPRLLEAGKTQHREPPMVSRCGFCHKEFSGKGGWETRMEHVGRHYEMSGANGEGVGPENWNMDTGLVEWAVRNRIVVELGSGSGRYRLAAQGGKEAVVENTGHGYGRSYYH